TPTVTEWIDEIGARLGHKLATAPLYTDFGGQAMKAPAAIVPTASVSDVLHVLDVANRHKVPIAVRGSGHSSGGHTEAGGGIVLRHGPEADTLRINSASVEVPGHWPWQRLETELRAN